EASVSGWSRRSSGAPRTLAAVRLVDGYKRTLCYADPFPNQSKSGAERRAAVRGVIPRNNNLRTAWESDASTRCMDENNYDREMCTTCFLKYKNCRKFWNAIMMERRRNGVKPPMPTAAEREKILGAMGKMPY
uniref:Coiled-coil-helix-coiled-coil-helix domain-containing protein 7 n=1 Tax=Vombatus ursinus TaxID=29139 RepID=A0A4X2LRB4_VOMUR